jgi:hypothetical protein
MTVIKSNIGEWFLPKKQFIPTKGEIAGYIMIAHGGFGDRAFTWIKDDPQFDPTIWTAVPVYY